MTLYTQPVFENVSKNEGHVNLPCNISFAYSEKEHGLIVAVFGFTAGPAAVIDSPQLLVPFYNPAAAFIGPSFAFPYIAYIMAFLDTDSTPTLKVHGWVTDPSVNFKFQPVSFERPLEATLKPEFTNHIAEISKQH